MRALFWILVLVWLSTGALATDLWMSRQDPSADAVGMVFIFFLPLCIASIISGAGAVMVQRAKAQDVPDLELKIGLAVGGLVVLEAGALLAVLAAG